MLDGCTVGWHFQVRALLVRDLQALSLAVETSTTSLPSPVKEKSAQFCKFIHSCRHLYLCLDLYFFFQAAAAPRLQLLLCVKYHLC